MFSWRARRQLTIMLGVFLVIGAIGFSLFRKVLPVPVCTDKKQNQGEFGVDCGGPCAPCELNNPRPINQFFSRAVPVRENFYDVAALVQNPNEVLSTADFTYEFTLLDQFGPVARRVGRTYLLAQERTTIIETNIPTTRQPTSVEFKTLHVKWEVRRDPKPNIIAERREYKVTEENGRKQSVVEASIFNGTAFDFREVVVHFVVLDPEGNLLGVNRITVEGFIAGTRRPVRAVWPEEFKGMVSTVEVEARVDVFDKDLIIKPSA